MSGSGIADWTSGDEAIVYQSCAACGSLQYFRRSFCATCGAPDPVELRDQIGERLDGAGEALEFEAELSAALARQAVRLWSSARRDLPLKSEIETKSTTFPSRF